MNRKFYKGLRDKTGPHVYLMTPGGNDGPQLLSPRYDLMKVAGGLDWGARIPGATQTAAAILADYFGDAPDTTARILDYILPFRNNVIALLPMWAWLLDAQDIEGALKKIDAAREGSGAQDE